MSIDTRGEYPFPHIIDGIPIHLRDIRVYVDRPEFTLNPTSCDPLSVGSELAGSAPPFTAGGVTATVADPYQAIDCSALGFGPRLGIRLRGRARRGGNPSLRAVVRERPGDADIAAAAVTLPPTEFLAQSHLRGICPAAAFGRGQCPRRSVYGHARAFTPLLEEPLEGPVYLVSSRRRLPDLVAALGRRGIAIDVVGHLGSGPGGGMRATFEGLPDAPASTFVMTLRGGRRGLLENAVNVCATRTFATARFTGQDNGAEATRVPLRGTRCKGRRGGHAVRGHRRGGRAAAALAAPRHEAGSTVTQKGRLRVGVSGGIAPTALPRRGTAPVAVRVGGRISTTDGGIPPQLRTLRIEINRHGRLDQAGLPVCAPADIEPATSARALAACRGALVGQGRFSADIVLGGQRPYPTSGRLLVFNGESHGRPALLGQIYTAHPFGSSFVITFGIRRRPRGRFGTELVASLPRSLGDWGHVTGISMTLSRRWSAGGRRHSYVSAGCPAPAGFPGATFPLARATFSFAGGTTIASTLTRGCRARG